LRYLIGASALLLTVVGGAWLLLPTIVDEARIERQLVAALAQWSGRDAAIDGGVEVRLLPRPLVSLERPRLGRADEPSGVIADRLDLDVGLLPLLAGRLEVTTAGLVRPRLWSTGPPGRQLDGLLGRLAATLAAAEGRLPLEALRVVDGTLAASMDGPALAHGINGTLERDTTTGTSLLVATGRLDAAPAGAGSGATAPADTRPAGNGAARTPLRLEIQLGRTAPGRPWPVQLVLEVTDAADPGRAAFRGHAVHDGALGRLDGRLEIVAHGLAVARLLPGLPLPALRLAATDGAAGLTLAADLVLERSAGLTVVALEQAVLGIAGQELAGAVRLATGPAPSIDLRLAAGRLELPDAAPLTTAELAGLVASLPGAATGRIEIEADELVWRRQKLRQVSAVLSLDGAGGGRIERARAVLPGPGDVAFTGTLNGIGGAAVPRLSGRLGLALQEPGRLLALIGSVPPLLRRSTTLAVDGEIDLAPGEVTLRETDLRLDALQASIGLAWRAAAAERPPRLALKAEIDRLALDQLLDLDTPERALESLLANAAATDLALDLEVERTSVGDIRLGRLVVAAQSEAARLSIERLALADIAGSALSLDGAIDAKAGAFDLRLGLDIASLPRLLRLARYEAPPALALLGPLNLRATLDGDLERADIAVELEADFLKAEGAAALTGWRDEPTGSAALAVDASDAAALLRQLTGAPVTSPQLGGALTADLRLGLQRGELATAALELDMGEVALELRSTEAPAASEGLGRLDLEIGRLDAATTAQLYALATPLLGLLPGPPGRWLGHWPGQPLDWRWLDAPRRELGLRLGPADPALPPIAIEAVVGDGSLTIPAFSWAGPPGRIEGGLALERLTAERVELALDVALERLPAAATLALLGIGGQPLEGTLDLEARLRTSGSSIHQLVSGVAGLTRFSITAGKLAPIPPLAAGPAGEPQPADPLRIRPPGAGSAAAPAAATGPAGDRPAGDGPAGDGPAGDGPSSAAGAAGADATRAEPSHGLAPAADATLRQPAVDEPAGAWHFERLEAALDVSRGVLRPAEGAIPLFGENGEATLSGYADLSAWIVDLEVAIGTAGDDGEATFRLFGPLGEPALLPARAD